MTIKKKPDHISESLRVLAIFDLIVDGLAEQNRSMVKRPILDEDAAVALLAIAERIAARTEAV